MERFDVVVVGAGVVGAATALELARRGASVVVCEAEPEPALEASATNSGIVHTGFDSTPGELETRLILRSAELRDELFAALGVPLRRCGALMRARSDEQAAEIAAIAAAAERNGVEVRLGEDGSLEVPGESITDPVVYVLALLAAAEALGGEVRCAAEVGSLAPGHEAVEVGLSGADPIEARAVVNCAGLGAGRVAELAGDRSFGVYPRKGEFLLFEPSAPLDRIELPVPTKRTKGVLAFPLLDGRAAIGPTAVDLDGEDWSVRDEARDELLVKARETVPQLAGREPIGAWAGLRPAGANGANYVIGRSEAEPRLLNVGAIRSTGLTASPAIAEYAAELLAEGGLVSDRRGAVPAVLAETPAEPWYERARRFREAA